MLIQGYTVAVIEKAKITKEVLYNEIMEENSKYKTFIDDRFDELNETNWS